MGQRPLANSVARKARGVSTSRPIPTPTATEADDRRQRRAARVWMSTRTRPLHRAIRSKLNSYDLGVDIELYDAIQRLRFEHPEVGCVVMTSDKPRVFCAGANINMLGQSTHAHKVNFCKFTNETRNGIEDATGNSRQTYICAINGTAAGAATSSRSPATTSC